MTMSISPSDMVLFAAVVREASFTRAAKYLGITKQTVSERVAKLEAALGVRLLERTTRTLRTTDTGRAYFDRCAAIAAQVTEANDEVQRGQTEPTGLLRVSAPYLYGRRFLAPVLAEFMARHQKTRVDLVLADRRVNLIEEGFDLAIRIGALDDSSLTARKLGDGHLYVCASPAFLKRAGVPITLRSLKTLRCIGTRPFETWDIGNSKFKLEPALVVNDIEVACEAAIAGVGIAHVPSLVAKEAVLSGRLRLLFADQPPAIRPVYAVYPSRQYLPAKVRLFVEALQAMVEPMQPIQRARRGA